MLRKHTLSNNMAVLSITWNFAWRFGKGSSYKDCACLQTWCRNTALYFTVGCRKCTLSVLFNSRVKSSSQTVTVRSIPLCYITAHLFLSKYYTMPKKLLVIWDEIHFHFTLVLFRLQDDSLISQAPKESLANGFKKKNNVQCCREGVKGMQLIFLRNCVTGAIQGSYV